MRSDVKRVSFGRTIIIFRSRCLVVVMATALWRSYQKCVTVYINMLLWQQQNNQKP